MWFAGPKSRILPALALASFFFARAESQEPSSALQQADAAYRAGVSALSAGKMAEAREDFARVVKLAPQVEQGHSAYGSVLVRMGASQQGIAELQKALAMKPDDTAAELTLALAYLQIGTAGHAAPLFARLSAAGQLPAADLPAYASALAATHQTAQATAAMERAVHSSPANAEWRDDLGSLYAQQRRWPEAEAEFRHALELAPESPAPHLHLGLALENEGKPGALDQLREASRLAPENGLAAAELGRALRAAGQDAEAVTVLRRAVQLPNAPLDARYQLALALQDRGNAKEAIPWFEKTVAAEPRNVEALSNFGLALMQAGRAKDALPYLQKAAALQPANTVARQDLAGAYIEVNQIGDAVTELRSAVKAAPDSPQLHYNLGLALKMADDNAAAIPEFEKSERLDPSGPEAPYALGTLYLLNGQYDQAARELERSLKERPQNPDGWATLGSVYVKQEKWPEATHALQEAIRQEPQEAEPHLTLANVLIKQGQPEAARAERAKAADLMRKGMDRQRAEVATHEGEGLLARGDAASAEEQFRAALGYDAQYAEARKGLADALDREGKRLEAASERRKAAESAGSP